MSLKSRLRRLEAGVRWLEREGVFVRAELARKLVERLQDMSDHAAAHPEAAAQWKKIRHLLPPPHVTVRAETPRVVPILRDAAGPAAPQDEGVRADAPTSALPPPEGSELAQSPPPRPPRPPQPPPPPPPSLSQKPRWTKDIRPGPHDVLTWDEVLQVPWVNRMAEDDTG